MIKIGDNYYRNLEEQVQKNKEDIANHYNIDRVLAEVGIKVIGQLPTPEDLEDKVGTEYGDAYAIGVEPPYDFYIWTRADVDSGHLEDYWFNIGQLAVIGPQGPAGPQGEKGDRGESSMWYYGTTPSNPREGDMLLQSSGNVLRYQKVGPLQYSWVQVVNIKGANGLNGLQGPQGATGPQGPQGPKGDTGDVGGFINIYGILTNVNQLPNPDALNNRTIAYLIGTEFPYDLYIQVGDADGPVTWINSGPLNVSTLVFVDGEAQNTWDADTKLDKDTSTTTYNQAYVKTPTGAQLMFNMNSDVSASTIAVRTADGQIRTSTPALGVDAANKQYVDNNFISSSVVVPNEALAWTIPQRTYNGRVVVGTPEENSDATTKEYVDTAIANIDIPEPDLTGYATETYVNEAVKNVEVDLTDYATKEYVDDAIANIDIPEGGGSGKTQISIETIDSPEMLALLAEAYSWGAEGNNILDKYDITYVRDGTPHTSSKIISVEPEVGTKRLIMTFIDENFRYWLVVWIQNSNKLEFGENAQILTEFNYSSYISSSGGGSDWKFTDDRYHWELYQAKEIYITFHSNDSKNVFSYMVLPEGETLASFTATDVMFTFDPRANPNYFFWSFDGSAIEFYSDDGSPFYDINKLLIAYKV